MRKSWTILLIAMIAAALFVCGCGSLTTGKGNLEGWVYGSSVEAGVTTLLCGAESNPAGVEGVEVTVEGTGRIIRTDAKGYFRIEGIEAGTCILDFAKPGYEPNRIQATVVANITRPAARAVAKKWTVMVYLDGDNNLEKYGILDVNEMETIGSTADVNVVVQFDRISNYDKSNGNWTNTRRYYILKDSKKTTINSSLIENMPEQQMDDPAVLQSFVNWGVQNYPATNYLLVMWNHGAGVWPKYKLVRGACFDDTSGSSACLTTDEIRSALAGVGARMNVLAWDACLMQMQEVAYELSSVCDYMVGSEQTTPGYGFAYDTLLGGLTANPSMTARDCANLVVDKFIEAYRTTAVCSSALDLTAWGTFVANVKAFASALNGTSSSNLAAIQAISAGCQRYDYPENVDLYDFAQGIMNSAIPDADLKTAARAVMASWSQAVINNKATGSLNNGRSHGLAILLPTTQTDWGYYSQYGDLMWPKDSLWNEFIVRISSQF